jgi:hypothetical protein
MTGPDVWLAERIDGAPAVLKARAEQAVLEVGSRGGSLAQRLVAASRLVLKTASVGGAGRSAAIELLSADALLTLALLCKAERSPQDLGAFAEAVRMTATTS